MKRLDLERILAETTVDRALREISVNPDRVLRKLVDMGHSVSKGRFQLRFFQEAQRLLERPNGAYYQLLRRITTEVAHERLKTFGLNLGYQGCTKGAQVIRAKEAEMNFNIPWALSFLIGSNTAEAPTPEDLSRCIREGKELGIYVYQFFFRENRLEEFLPILRTHDDCACVLYLEPADITDECLRVLAPLTHVMISIAADQSGTPDAAKRLNAGKYLYALHSSYSEETADSLLSDEHLRAITAQHPLFYILLSDHSTTEETIRRTGQRVELMRSAQNHPLLLMDLANDMLTIDRVVSEDGCAIVFNSEGYAYNGHQVNRTPARHLRHAPLAEILRSCNPKK